MAVGYSLTGLVQGLTCTGPVMTIEITVAEVNQALTNMPVASLIRNRRQCLSERLVLEVKRASQLDA